MTRINKKKVSYLLILCFLLGHLVYLNTPFVNLEWVYKAGTQYYLTWDYFFLDQYFSGQANPLTYSFLSSFFVAIFGDNYINYRILALLGGSLILVAMARYKSPFLILIIGLNPLIWVYSGRAYSELLSVGLLVVAIELHKNGYLKGLIAGLSSIVKFHSILFSGPYWGLLWLEKIAETRKLDFRNINFISALTCVIIFISFLFSYLYLYDIWIVPDKWKDGLAIQAASFLDNFFSYGFYLSALFFFTIPFFLRNTPLRKNLLAIAISIPLAIINQDNGEMNFGSLDQLLGYELILIIKIFGFWNFILCMELFLREKDLRIMTSTILFYILLLSATRPAQRYLLFIIPFWALLVVESKIQTHYIYKSGYVSLLLLVAVFSSLYQVANANASKDVSNWSEQQNLKIDTNYIYPHVGDSKMHSFDSDISVQIKITEDQNVLYSSPVQVLGYELRRYYVVKNQAK